MNSRNHHHKQTITLIGAGLVGSLLAVLLARRGFKVELFERRADMRKQQVSAGRSINLALANRGIYPLEQAGLMEQVRPILTTMKGRMIHDVNGSQSFQSYGQRTEEVIYSVSRGDLNKICMDAAEQTGLVDIHFNKKCEAIDLTANSAKLVDTVTGEKTHHSFSQVIGTDGSASAVRQAIHNLVSEQHDIIPLGHSYKELRIPAGKDGSFQLNKNALHIWPRGGYMLIALPNEDGSFTVTLFMPSEGEISFAEINTAEKINDFFTKYFCDLLPLLPELKTDYFQNPTGSLATVKCSPWHYQNKALIIGDAAHAVVPFHGQGMNCAFEDAISLVETIDQQRSDKDLNWHHIFSTLNNERKLNGDAIADMAIDNYITMRDSVRDEKFIFRNVLAFELEKRFPTRFCPRYSMVMFHRLPYAVAQQRGNIQAHILKALTEKAVTLEQVDFDLARRLIEERLTEVELNRGSLN